MCTIRVCRCTIRLCGCIIRVDVCRLEQELMARMLMKMHPMMSTQTDVLEQDDVADRSDSIPDDESLLGKCLVFLPSSCARVEKAF